MSHTENSEHLKIQLEAIKSATNNFSDDSCIGRGGFGKVYKGKVVISNCETMVALKRLDRAFGQGDAEFWKEIMMLPLYRHENIVSLLGYCDDHGEKILVYEYASKKSLDSYLTSNNLTWLQRLKICVGAARGLAYLHKPADTQLRILHRDIKSSNILLDDNWNAKISDFGLSKFAPANKHFTFLVSNPVGTHGYIDPLYHETGLLTKESDVYSFGVVLFEVLCGRLCFGNKDLRPLIGLVREYYEQNKISELIYTNIKDEIDMQSLKLFVEIAYQCLRRERKERPLMTQIVSALERALDIQENAYAEATANVTQSAGILNVKVLRAMDDGSGNPFGASNHYFVIYLDYATSVYNQVKVEWNEESTLYVENFDAQILNISVTKVVSLNKHCQQGEASMQLKDLIPDIPMTLNLAVWDKKYVGHLEVEVLYKPVSYGNIRTYIEDVRSLVPKGPEGTPKDGGLLVIIIHRALLDVNKYKHSSIKLHFRDQIRKTPSIMNTNTPKWLQEFTFMLEQPPTDENLRIEVFNHYSWMGLIRGKEFIGYINIRLADVVSQKRTCRTCAIKQVNNVDGTIPEYVYLEVELQWRTSD